MSNYHEDKPGFREVRDAYDAMVSARTARRREAMLRIERECAAQDQAELESLAQMMHDYYRGGTTKTVLRNATRQYGSPKFTDMWDMVPFAGTRGKQAPVEEALPYGRTEDRVTFFSGGELELPEGHESLTYQVIWSEANDAFLAQGETPDHALFYMKNKTAVNDVINNKEDFNV